MKQAKKIFSESGKPMLSSRVAALRLSCAQDYIGKLCREGKLVGRQINGSWFVDELSVKSFELSRKEAKTARSKELSELRKEEQRTHEIATRTPLRAVSSFASSLSSSFLPKNISRQVAVVGIASLLIGAGVFGASAFFTKSNNPVDAQAAALGQLQSPFFGTGGQVSVQDFGSAIASFFENLFGSKQPQVADNTSAAQKDTTPVVAAPEAATSSPAVAQYKPLPKTVSSAPANIIQNTYPIRERVVERVVLKGGITQEALTLQLQQLGNALRSELYGSINGLSSVPPAQGGMGGAIAISQNISKLFNVTITNGTVHGLAGLTASDIPALSYFPATTSISTVYGGTGITSYSAGDLLYANSAGTLSVLSVGSTGKVLKISGGLPAWGTDISGSGGSSAWATTTDNLAVYPSDTTQVVLIGASATSTTGNIFETLGNSLFRGSVTAYNTLTAPNFTATSTTAKSTFPFASSTALTVSGTASTSKLFVDGLTACDTTTGKLLWSNGTFSCGTDFNTGGGGGTFPFTPTTNYGALANSTSTPIWFAAGLQASSTSHFAAVDIATALGATSGGTGQNTYAVGDLLYANGANTLTKLPVGATGQVIKVSGGVPAWGADNTGSGGNSLFASTTDSLAIYPSTVSSVFLLGASATTTTGNIFEVLGNSLFRGSIAVTGTASTSNLTVSLLPATILSTNAIGVAQLTTISAPLAFSGSTLSITQSGIATNGYLSSADYTIFNNKISSSSLSQIFPFTPSSNYGSLANSTSTAIWFTAGLQASSTSRFVYASSTALTVSGTASTSKLYVDGLQACDTTTGKLLWSGGTFSCGTDFNNGVGGGSAFAWTPTTNYGALANSTSTPIWFAAGLQSSSTIQTTSINIDQNSGYQQAGVTILSASSTNLSTLVGNGAGAALKATGLYNTAVGYHALNAAVTASNLTAVGYNTLSSNITGANNVALGSSALAANVSGFQNSAFGSQALAANVTGSNNLAAGYNALSANTTGANNTAIGSGALAVSSGSSNNSAVGYNSLTADTTGYSNSALGSGALTANTTGYQNAAFGFNALGANTTGYDNIAIGAGALAANTAGGVENTAIGYNALTANTTGVENIAVGGSALAANTTGLENIAIGVNVLVANTTGFQNSGLGYNALGANTTGTSNTALGFGALRFNNVANSNTAVGFQAGYGVSGLTASQNNVFLGYQAGSANTTGASNTLLGYKSGIALTTGSNNIVIGDDAGSANSLVTGTSNIIIGSGISATSSTSGNALIIGNLLYGIGFGAGSTPSTGVAGIATTSPFARFSVDSSALGSGVPSFVVGSSTRTDLIVLQSGRVGVGTSSPAFTFSINGTGYTSGASFFGGAITATSTLTIAGIITSTATAANVFPYASSTAFTVSGTGYFGTVGIGSSSPASTLSVNGTSHISGASFFGGAITASSTLAVTGSTTISSVLNVGGQLNANLSAVIASTTLSGSTLFGNATSSGSLAINASTTIAGQFNATGGASFGTASYTGVITSTATGANVFPFASSTALTVSGTGYFGAIGIGTSSPYAALSVAGQSVFNYITATGTTASTFMGATFVSATSSAFAVTGSSTISSVLNIGGQLNANISALIASTTLVGNTLLTNATTTNLYATAYFAGAGLGSCIGNTAKLAWSNGQFSCGADMGSLGNDVNWTFFGNGGLRPATSTNQLLLGATATSSGVVPMAILNVIGGAGFDAATSTYLNVSTFASTSALSVSNNALFYSNVGLGSTSPSARLSVFGGNIVQQATGTPVLATSTPTSVNPTYGSAVSGNYVYIADGASGLHIYDNSNPRKMTLVGTYSAGLGGALSVAVAGQYAYVGDNTAGLVIVDVSNPSAPSLVGSYAGGDAWGIALSGKYAYVSNFTGGRINVVDVSDPRAPFLVNAFSVGGNPYGLVARGRYLYIANQVTIYGLQIVDISNPTAPVIAGSYTGGLNPTGVYVSGKYAYVADASKGLLIVDVSNPKSPTLTGAYEPTGQYYGVSVAGNYAYAADHAGLVKVIDISNPAAPHGAGILTLPSGLPNGITVVGKYAYVANNTSGLAVVDINGIEAPSANIGSISANSVDISDNLVVGGNVSAGGGLNVGISGIFSRGVISAFIASTTQTNPVVATFIGGNVGIGTSSPYAALSVAGQSVFNYITATGTTASTFTGAVFNSATTSAFAVTGSTTISSVLNIGGQLNANLSAIIASTTLSGSTLFGNATSSGSLAINASTTVTGQFNALGGATLGITTHTGLATFAGATFTSATTSALSVSASSTIAGVLNALGGANFGTQTNTGLATLNAGFYSTASSTLSASFFSTLNNYLASTTLAGNTLFGNATSSGSLSINASTTVAGQFNAVGGATLGITTIGATRTSGVTPYLTLTGTSDTGLTTGTEAPDIQFNLARTKTHTNGTITLQRDFLVNAATHSFTNFAGGLITDLATFAITGAPLAGTNATTTNAHTMYLGASALNASTTNSYGLTVNANTGAVNNYAAAFLGGRVGIGTSSPLAQLTVATQNGADGSVTNLFLIASSTSSATTTLFSVSNTGLTTLLNLSATSATTSALSVSASSTIASVLNVGGQLNVNLSAIIASTTLAGSTLFGNATTSGSLSISASTTIAGVLNAIAGANFGTQTNTGLATLNAGFYSTASSTLSASFFSTLNNYLASTTLAGNTLFGNATSSGSLSINASTTVAGQFNAVGGATLGIATLSGALTYGGVTLGSAVTGTGNMVLSISPTITGTSIFNNATFVAATTSALSVSASSTIAGQFNAVGGANFGITTIGGALTYGGVTLGSAVTGTGNMVLSISPTITGTAVFSNATFSAATTSALAVTGSTTISSVLNIGGQLNANLSAIIASTTLTGSTLFGNATTSGSLAINASSTIAGVLNALGGASLGTATFAGTITAAALNTSGAITSTATGANTFPFASTTALTVSGTGYFGTASTSNLTVSLLPATILSTNATGVAQATTVSAPLAFSGSTLSITQSGTATNGYLSSADYTIFNNKISSSSLSQIFPFTPSTQYGLNTNATTTLLQLTNGFTASSTSHLVDFDFRSATGTSLALTASSTVAGQLNAVGGLTVATINASGGYTQSGTSANTFTGTPTFSNVTYSALFTGGNVGIGTTTPGALFAVHGNGLFSGNLSIAGLAATSTVAINSAARTSGSTALLSLIAGSDTGLTASTEVTDIQFNLARTKTHGNGTITLQRDFLVNAATHSFTNWAGGLITDLATFAVTGAPITASTGNGTTTNAHTVLLSASALNASTTNSYGLTVNANTGAANNYAAAFLGGNVGIGTSSPYAMLSVAGQSVFNYITATGTTASTFTGAVFNSATTSALAVTGSSTIASVLNVGGQLNVNLSALIASTTLAGSTLFGNATTSGSLAINASTTVTGQFNALGGATLGITTIGGALTYGGVTLSNAVTGTGNMALSASPTFTGTVNGVSLLFNASSTIGAGGQATGLTISGGATTTGNAYFAGNVGLGTTSPSQVFSVTGKVYTTGGIQFADGSLQTAAAAAASVGTAGQIGFYATNGSTISGTSTLFIASNQNIGIGTSSPYAMLSVAGQSVFNYITATGTTASTFTGATFNSATTSAFAVTGSTTIASVLNVGGQLNVNLSAIIASTTLAGSTLFGNATSSGSLAINASTTVTGQFNALGGATLGITTIGGALTYGGVTLSNAVTGTGNMALSASPTFTGTVNGAAATWTGNDTAAAFIPSGSTVPTNGLFLPAANSLGLSSNSTERVRIDSTGNVGIGTTSPYAKLSVVGAAVAEYFNATSTLATSTFAGGIVGPNSFVVQQTSGNVGIGTTGPNTLLELYGSGNIIQRITHSDTAGASSIRVFEGAAEQAEINIWGTTHAVGATRQGNLEIINLANKNLSLWTNSAERLTVQNNGNVGIGTTSPYAKLSVVGAAVAEYFNATSTLATSTFAGGIVGPNSFVVQQTSGNVGIGTTAPGDQLHVSGAGTTTPAMVTSTSMGGTLLLTDTGGAPGNGGAIVFGAQGGSWNFASIKGMVTNGGGNSQGDIVFSTRPTAANGTLTEAMRVMASGNVGIGTTGPGAKLTVLGGEGSYNAPNFGSSNLGAINIPFVTSNTQNGITFSSAGASNAQAGIYVHQDNSAGTHMYFATTDSYVTGPQARMTILNNGNVGIGTTSPDLLLSVGSATPVGSVAHFENSTGSCYINPTTTALVCTSDARLKTNVNPLADTSGLDALSQLNPVTYNWIKGEATGSPTHAGFIAQQVQQVMPDLIMQAPDGYLTMNYAGLTPYLVKGLQQLNAKVDGLSSALASSTRAVYGDATSTVASVLGSLNNASESFSAALASSLSAAGSLAQTGVRRLGEAVYAKIGIFAELFATHVHAQVVTTESLCLTGAGGETCINKAQLDQLLANSQSGIGSSSPSGQTLVASGSSADTTPPTITLNGNNPASVAIGAVYSDLGAVITDNVSTNVGYTVSLDNATSTDLSNLRLDTGAGGTHYIVFTAADQAGNVSHATRTVIVGDGTTVVITPPVTTTATSTPVITPVVITTATSTVSTSSPQAATSTTP